MKVPSRVQRSVMGDNRLHVISCPELISEPDFGQLGKCLVVSGEVRPASESNLYR
jgi:hypothetical protein